MVNLGGSNSLGTPVTPHIYCTFMGKNQYLRCKRYLSLIELLSKHVSLINGIPSTSWCEPTCVKIYRTTSSLDLQKFGGWRKQKKHLAQVVIWLIWWRRKPNGIESETKSSTKQTKVYHNFPTQLKNKTIPTEGRRPPLFRKAKEPLPQQEANIESFSFAAWRLRSNKRRMKGIWMDDLSLP